MMSDLFPRNLALVSRFLLLLLLATAASAFQSPLIGLSIRGSSSHILLSASEAIIGQATELPDSLEDAAQIAAKACHEMIVAQGPSGRARIDFDTSAGDETFTLLKQSTEFMQNLVTSLCYLQMPELQTQKQSEMMKVVEAQNELQQLQQKMSEQEEEQQQQVKDNETTSRKQDSSMGSEEVQQKMEELQQIINRGGRDPNYKYEGPKARIYFPDEGNAALARRDWINPKNGGAPLVPPCVEFSSCGGIQGQEITNDMLIFFFCPKASESEYVEQILQSTETSSSGLQLSVFVNPNLVDMGVTGFGMTGRLLRERLIDPLPYAYYLRTLQWGALTRVWPRDFSVWQEDEKADDGYRLIRTLPYLPSNPEVEDIYDVENGLKNEKNRSGGGFLDQLGDFVNGMTKL